MQVSIESTSSIARRMTVGLPTEQLDTVINKRLKETSQRVRIDGFRPGKVPASVIKQRYGASIRAEAIDELIRNSLGQAFAQEKVNPAGMPKIDSVNEEKADEIEYVATFEVFPEIKLGSTAESEFTRATASIEDADIDKMLESLQKQKATFKAVERAAALSDQITISFVGKLAGEEFQGGTANDVKLVLGSGQMVPGFEDALVGIEANQGKEITVTFPEDYQAEELKGKEVTFDVKCSEVAEEELPELDEAFFKEFGAKETTPEGFRTEVRGNMEREALNALKAKLKNSVIDALLEVNDFEVPQALVDEEIKRLKEDAVKQFGQGAKIDASALPSEMFQDQGVRRVKVGLVINEVINTNEIKADDEAVNAYLEDMASVYQDPKSVVEYYQNNAEQLNQIKAVVLEEAAIEKVLSDSKVTEASVSYEDAVKAENKAA